jgi:hypothetical protein
VDLAYAVVHDDPPRVFAAENIDVLHRVLAIEVVARTPGRTLPSHIADQLREALLDERWGDAVELWMRISGTVLDVYGGGLLLWTDQRLQADVVGLQVQFTPLFED